jgi:Tfp pilus assembly protein PilF
MMRLFLAYNRQKLRTKALSTYLAKGMFKDALQELETAIKIAPDYRPAHILRHKILAMLN